MMKWIFILLLAVPAWAQEEISELLQQLEVQSMERGGEREFQFSIHNNDFGYPDTISGFLTEPGEFEGNAMYFLEVFGSIFGLEEAPFAHLEFRRSWDPEVDLLPFMTFDQYYEGIRVFNGVLSVHGDLDGAVFDVYSSLKPIDSIRQSDLDFNPTFPEYQLEELLSEAAVNANPPMVLATEEPLESSLLENLVITQPYLVLFQNPSSRGWHLAYEIKYGHLENYARYLIDAHSGEILRTEPLAYSLGHTIGSGTNTQGQQTAVNVWQYHSQQAPVPARKFFGRNVAEANNTFKSIWDAPASSLQDNTYISLDGSNPNAGQIFGTVFNGQSPLIVRSATTNLDTLFGSHISKAAVDNLSSLRKSVDFFLNEYSWKGMDNKGSDLLFLARYGNPRNAFFIPDLGVMVTGSGTGNIKHLGAALDIVAHEFAHGVTEYRTARGLPYRNETGAINEHISDLYGALIQSNYDRLNWTMGEDANFTIRNFQNPEQFGHPSKIAGNHYFAPMNHTHALNDSGGVHIMSGIANKALYLMANGGTYNGRSFPAFDSDPKVALARIGELYYHAMPAMLPDIGFWKLREILFNTAFKIFSQDPNGMSYLQSINGAWGSVGLRGGPYLPGSMGDAEPNDYHYQVAAHGDSQLNIWTYGSLSRNMPIYGRDTDIYQFENVKNNTPFTLSLKMLNASTTFSVKLFQHANSTTQLLPLTDFRATGGGYSAVLPAGRFSVVIEQLNWETSIYRVNLQLAKFASELGDQDGPLFKSTKFGVRIKIRNKQPSGNKSIAFVNNASASLAIVGVSTNDPKLRAEPWSSGSLRVYFEPLDRSSAPRSVLLEKRKRNLITLPKSGYYRYWIRDENATYRRNDCDIFMAITQGNLPSP